jgi:hypothetical protein
MLDTKGQLRLIKVPAFYVPKSKDRVLSTTSFLQTYEGENIEVDGSQMKVSGLDSDSTRGAVVAIVNPRNNLPMTTSYRYDEIQAVPVALSAAIPSINEANIDLSDPEKDISMGLSAYHAFTVPFVLSPDSPEWSQPFRDSVWQYQFDDDDLANAIDLTAPPTPTDADRVVYAADQLESSMRFRCAPPSVAPLPQLIVDAVLAPTTSTVTVMSAPRERMMSAPRELVVSAPRELVKSAPMELVVVSAPRELVKSAPRELVESAPREPAVSAPREPRTSLPREPSMPPPREFEAVQQREIPATIVPTPSPKRNAPATSCSIKLSECSLRWTSQLIRWIIQLQTEMSLDTLEPKYEFLSYTMRTLLPIRRMIEGALALQLPSTLQATSRAEVSEDNNGTLLEVCEDNNEALLVLATDQRVTARTQFLLDKWHLFWYQINNGDAKVSKVPTELQDADYFTKGLPRESFERNRLRVQSW